jgi:uncharacterized membrane protein
MAGPTEHLRGAFGQDRFGQAAEKFARVFGTPTFIVGQTILVAIWIVLNGLVVALRWDPYPFILLNLAFSTQAAYAAPLILLAQTRQADRDAHHSRAVESLHEKEEKRHSELLTQNGELITRIEKLTEQIKAAVDR